MSKYREAIQARYMADVANNVDKIEVMLKNLSDNFERLIEITALQGEYTCSIKLFRENEAINHRVNTLFKAFLDKKGYEYQESTFLGSASELLISFVK